MALCLKVLFILIGLVVLKFTLIAIFFFNEIKAPRID